MDDPITVYSNKPDELVQKVTFVGAGQTKYYEFANMSGNALELIIESSGVDVMIEFVDGETVEPFSYFYFRVTAKEAGEATLTISIEEIETENQ